MRPALSRRVRRMTFSLDGSDLWVDVQDDLTFRDQDRLRVALSDSRVVSDCWDTIAPYVLAWNVGRNVGGNALPVDPPVIAGGSQLAFIPETITAQIIDQLWTSTQGAVDESFLAEVQDFARRYADWQRKHDESERKGSTFDRAPPIPPEGMKWRDIWYDLTPLRPDAFQDQIAGDWQRLEAIQAAWRKGRMDDARKVHQAEERERWLRESQERLREQLGR